jgi:flagellar biosynthesis/type III secretory pathway protein FliH
MAETAFDKLTKIADKIRVYTYNDSKLYSLDDMATGVEDVYSAGNNSGYSDGYTAGYDEGVIQGQAQGNDKMLAQSMELSVALNSGEEDVSGLEVNVDRAVSDIVAIKTLIESYGVEVPVGTPSSTYDETIEGIIRNTGESRFMEGVTNGWEGGSQDVIDNTVSPANKKICDRIRNGDGVNSSLDTNINVMISDFDAIESKIEEYGQKHGVSVPDNNTSTMASCVQETIESVVSAASTAAYNDGYTKGETSKQEEIDELTGKQYMLSASLQQALDNIVVNTPDALEDNIDRAISDIGSIKNLIIDHGISVPTGTPSSTYDETISQIIIDERTMGYVDGESAGYENGLNAGILQQQSIIDGHLTDFNEIKDAVNQEDKEYILNDTPTSDYAEKINLAIVETSEEKYADGYSEGQAFGIEQGRKAECEEFWKVFQNEGKRANYQYAFQTGWNQHTFKPKYDMILTNCNNMFGGTFGNNSGLDLRKSAIGITIDFSKCTSFNNCFSYAYDSSVVAIGTIDTRKATSLANMFNSAYGLHTVEKLILKDDGSQTYLDMSNASALENITVEGVVGSDISFKSSPLTKASIMGRAITEEEYSILDENVKTNNVISIGNVYYYGGIITALKRDASGKTLTLKKTAVNTAFGINVDDVTTWAEGSEYYTLRHSKDNWTISYV